MKLKSKFGKFNQINSFLIGFFDTRCVLLEVTHFKDLPKIGSYIIALSVFGVLQTVNRDIGLPVRRYFNWFKVGGVACTFVNNNACISVVKRAVYIPLVRLRAAAAAGHMETNRSFLARQKTKF